jgi:hypothetical protein
MYRKCAEWETRASAARAKPTPHSTLDETAAGLRYPGFDPPTRRARSRVLEPDIGHCTRSLIVRPGRCGRGLIVRSGHPGQSLILQIGCPAGFSRGKEAAPLTPSLYIHAAAGFRSIPEDRGGIGQTLLGDLIVQLSCGKDPASLPPVAWAAGQPAGARLCRQRRSGQRR